MKNINIVAENKNLIHVFGIPAVLMILPLIGSLVFEGWNWGVSDYFFAYFFGVTFCALYTFVASTTKNTKYKMAIGFAVLVVAVLLWIELAVGIFS